MQPSVVGGSCKARGKDVVAAVAVLVDVEAHQEGRISHPPPVLAPS